MYLQRSFTVDDRVAWAYVTIPHAALNGETVDEWFPLSGKQGDEKEGMLNLVMTFTVSFLLIPYLYIRGIQIHTHYYCSNLIWQTLSCFMDELISSDHMRCFVSHVIRWHQLIHEKWYSPPDQVTTVMMFLLYILSFIFVHNFTHIMLKPRNYWHYVSDIYVISGWCHNFGSIT